MNLDRVIAVRNNKTIYRDGDRCVKVFNKKYSKADVLNEALNHSRVEQTDLNIPKILEVSMIDGKWAIVSEYIKGKNLSQLFIENPDKKREYFDLFADMQMHIHKNTLPLLNNLKDKMSRKISETALDEKIKNNLRARLDAMPDHKKVCHGDFNPSNIIISEQGLPYILDWAHATSGNASADVARTYLLFWLNGDISGADYYLDSFCKKSDTDKQYVKMWMPIVAASQLLKGNEKEREFLISWIEDT